MHYAEAGPKAPEPLSRALPVEKPGVAKIRVIVEDRTVEAGAFIAQLTYADANRMRMRLQYAQGGGAAPIACPLCGTPLGLRLSPGRRWFFAHAPGGGPCEQKDEQPNQAAINAKTYALVREGSEHVALKRRIAETLAVDDAFEDVAIERRIVGTAQPGTWRQPDVQAVIGGRRLAIEGQVSTTFLSVIAERTLFYRDEGMGLLWVLPSFEPDRRRQMVDDVIYSRFTGRGGAAVVVDEDTLAHSRSEGVAYVRLWTPPGEGQGAKWHAQDLPLAALADEAFEYEDIPEEAFTPPVPTEAVGSLEMLLPPLAWGLEPYEQERHWRIVQEVAAARGAELPSGPPRPPWRGEPTFVEIADVLRAFDGGEPYDRMGRPIGVRLILAARRHPAVAVLLASLTSDHDAASRYDYWPWRAQWAEGMRMAREAWRKDRNACFLPAPAATAALAFYPQHGETVMRLTRP